MELFPSARPRSSSERCSPYSQCLRSDANRAVRQTFTVHYNSTLAAHQPVYYDAYIQGTFSNGNLEPQYLLQRFTFPTDGTKDVYFNTTVSVTVIPFCPVSSDKPSQLPNIEYQSDSTYAIWAMVTYPVNDVGIGAPALQYGGVSWPIGVDLS